MKFTNVKSLLITLLFFSLFAFEVFAQSTITGTVKQHSPQNAVWIVASGDFDSTDVIWSPAFILRSATTTFDAQGTTDLGTVASGGTYSTVLLLYGSVDDENSWQLVDSLGTITATTSTKFDVDLDDWDQTPLYKFKATNSGGNNSLKTGVFRE